MRPSYDDASSRLHMPPPPASSLGILPSNEMLTGIFRIFDADHSSRLNFAQFLSLITSLLTIQRRDRPPPQMADDIARDIAKNMTITDTSGRVMKHVHTISLSDFITASSSSSKVASKDLQQLLANATQSCNPVNLVDALRQTLSPQSNGRASASGEKEGLRSSSANSKE